MSEFTKRKLLCPLILTGELYLVLHPAFGITKRFIMPYIQLSINDHAHYAGPWNSDIANAGLNNSYFLHETRKDIIKAKALMALVDDPWQVLNTVFPKRMKVIKTYVTKRTR